MRNKKMAAARAGLSSAMFAFFFPYEQYTLPFFLLLSKWGIWCREALLPQQVILYSLQSTFSALSGFISRVQLFSSGRKKRQRKIQEHKSSISDRKGLLLIDGR